MITFQTRVTFTAVSMQIKVACAFLFSFQLPFSFTRNIFELLVDIAGTY